MKNLKLVKKEQTKTSPIRIGNLEAGRDFILIAGPCSIENEVQLFDTARQVKDAGANMLRGGAFKPRTSPYAFQGLGEEGLKILAAVRDETGLPVVTELMNIRYAELVNKYADAIQVGARNMQNFDLLKEIGKMRKPVILKRGMSATIKELLMSAEYIASEGNSDIILCERGIRTFERATRNTLDICAVPVLKERTHLPVIVDPEYHYEALNVETQSKNPSSLLWWMKRLISIRKNVQPLARGDLRFLFPENPRVLAFTRNWQGETLLVVANLSRYVEYVELMKEMRLELAAEYLVMAAILAEIKSRMLLPRPAAV